MASSILYAVNSTTQPTVATGTVVNFGVPVRRYGSLIQLSGGNVEISGMGYYNIDVSVDILGTAAGTLLIQVYKDGVLVPGAIATRTTGDGSNYTVTIPTVVRQKCCCSTTITVVASGVASSITNAAIRVEKV